MVSKKELKNVSNLSPKERYGYFIKKVVDFEVLYGIKDSSGDWVLADAKDNSFFMLWPTLEFVNEFIEINWSDCFPVRIEYNEFEEKIVKLVKEKKLLLNIFSIKEKTGFIVTLEEFMRDMSLEFEKYE